MINPFTGQVINNMKFGTKKLIQGFQVHDTEEQGRIVRGLTKKSPSEIRKSSAIGMRAMKKLRGSNRQREIVKTYAPKT